jgi:hypothetical protein
VNLLTVNGCNEGLVKRLVDFMRDAICCAFGMVDIAVVFFAQSQVTVIGNEFGKCMRSVDDVVGVLVEQFEKIGVARKQFAKKHEELLGDVSKP